MTDVPCFGSLENWLKKSGYSIYNDSLLKTSETDYGLIVDESIMLGNERLFLTLGIQGDKTTSAPLNINDVEVVGIHVKSKWHAENLVEALQADESRMGKKPSYIISDNDAKLRKAISNYGCTHIRDIGHTMAMFLQRVYEKEKDFQLFFKKIGRLKIEGAMNDCSYLLPPRQRTIARFMNISGTIVWAQKIIHSYSSFTEKEKQVYAFVVNNKKLISELQPVFECTNQILSDIKTNGLSYNSIGSAMSLINKKLKESKKSKKRISKFCDFVIQYLLQEAIKLKDSETNLHASSDMIESIFGTYKYRKAKNSLHGVTSYVFILPLITKLKDPEKGLEINVKANLENVYMRNIWQWEKDNLTENLSVKRRKKLAA